MKIIHRNKSWSGGNRTHIAEADVLQTVDLANLPSLQFCGRQGNPTPAFIPATVFKTACPHGRYLPKYSGEKRIRTVTAFIQSTLAMCCDKPIFAFSPCTPDKIRTCTLEF